MCGLNWEVLLRMMHDKGNHSSLSSEHRQQNLELELAQTKLALVESQCKNQELEHKVKEASEFIQSRSKELHGPSALTLVTLIRKSRMMIMGSF